MSGATESLIESAGYSMKRLVGDDGAHPLRVLISFIPVLLAWFDRKTIEEKIIELIRNDCNITRVKMADNIGVSEPTIKRAIRASKKIKYVGSSKGGHWEVIE